MTQDRNSSPRFINPPTETISANRKVYTANSPTIVNNSNVIYTQGDNIKLKTGFHFISISRDPELSRSQWFYGNKALPDLRVRIIYCLNSTDDSRYLDFISQRINEYQGNIYSKTGQDQVIGFYNDLVNQQRFSVEPNFDYLRMTSMLGTSGPFDSVAMTRKMKNTNSKVFHYKNSSNVPSGMFFYDAPLKNLLLKQDDGKIITEPLDSITRFAGNVKQKELYNAYKVMATDIEIDISDLVSANAEIGSMSVYSYTYFDYQSYLERHQEEAVTESVGGSILINGCGFIDRTTMLGQQQFYATLTSPVDAEDTEATAVNPGFSVPSSKVVRTATSPKQDKLVDARIMANLSPDNVRDKVYSTFYSTLIKYGFERGTVQTIKDRNFVSNLWLSTDKGENNRLTFAVDKASYFVHNSTFPFLYVSPGSRNELLRGGRFIKDTETSEIVECRMKKRRIKDNAYISDNPLVSGLGLRTYENGELENEKYIATAMRNDNIYLPINSNGDVEFYEAMYTNSSEKKLQSAERCQYGVEILFKDSSILYMGRVRNTLDKSQKLVREIYRSITTSPPLEEGSLPDPSTGLGIYDYKASRIRVPLDSIKYNRSNAQEIITNEINNMLFIYDNLGIIESKAVPYLRDSLLARISYGNPEEIRSIANSIQALGSEISLIIKSVAPNSTKKDLQHSVLETSKNANYSFPQYVHYFPEFVDYGVDYKSGYCYIYENSSNSLESTMGLGRIDKQSLLARRDLEFRKYFDNPTTSGKINIENTSFADSSLQYFSPLSIGVWGRETINQPVYKMATENITDYDFNVYARLLLDILNLEKAKKQKQTYVCLRDETINQSLSTKLFKETKELLFDHACTISTSPVTHFSALEPGTIKDKMSTVVKDGETLEATKNTTAVSSLLGGGKEKAPAAENFAKDLNKELTSTDFSEETKKQDEDPTTKSAQKNPIKLAFNIIGELTLNTSTNQMDLNYMDVEFNSFSKYASLVGLDPENYQNILSSRYKSIPNQTKAMMILSSFDQGLKLEDSFDAVRPRLKDKTAPSGESFISAVFDDKKFPPYEITGDPMKTYAKFLAFWMNYKQLGVLEYLAGFSSVRSNAATETYLQTDTASSYYMKTKAPVWRKFTEQFYDSNLDKTFLCRIRPITWEDYNGNQVSNEKPLPVSKKESFDLPIYDQYFLITG